MKMRKLRSEKGVTILMALLLVLVAAMVSAVILSAAVSAVRRVRSDRDAQQDYLAVSSAAELIRDSILDDSYGKTVVTVTRMDENGDPLEPDAPTASETLPSGLMSAWLTAGARAGGCSDDISLEISGGETDGKFKTVRVQFTMDSEYHITAALSLADAANDCRMTLTLNGTSVTNSVESNDEASYTTITKTTITWDNPRIVKGTEGA